MKWVHQPRSCQAREWAILVDFRKTVSARVLYDVYREYMQISIWSYYLKMNSMLCNPKPHGLGYYKEKHIDENRETREMNAIAHLSASRPEYSLLLSA